MDDHEKFLFDLNGYLVLENVLTPDEVAACNRAIDQNPDRVRVRSEEQSLSGKSKALKGKQGRGDIWGMLTWAKPWCQPFRDLLAHPKIVPVLTEILGEGFRLDHLYGIAMEAGSEGHVLHGGGTHSYPIHHYECRNEQIRCGLTVVAWSLTDCGPGDGGFACIPGSHKSNFPTPPDVARLERDLGVVKQVVVRAGSAIIFTEALTHGTMPWRAKHERRSILYKYSPGPLSYAGDHLPEGVAEDMDAFTPEQQAVLEPPHRIRPRTVEEKK